MVTPVVLRLPGFFCLNFDLCDWCDEMIDVDTDIQVQHVK